MTKEVVELFKRASDLPDSDRAMLAGLLIESLDSEHEPNVESAWFSEIERRVQELDSGSIKTVPWPQIRAKLSRLIQVSGVVSGAEPSGRTGISPRS